MKNVENVLFLICTKDIVFNIINPDLVSVYGRSTVFHKGLSGIPLDILRTPRAVGKEVLLDVFEDIILDSNPVPDGRVSFLDTA